MKYLLPFNISEAVDPGKQELIAKNLENIQIITDSLHKTKEGMDLLGIQEYREEAQIQVNKHNGRLYLGSRFNRLFFYKQGDLWVGGLTTLKEQFESPYLEDLFRTLWIKIASKRGFKGIDRKGYLDWLSSQSCPAHGKGMEASEILKMWISTLPPLQIDPNIIIDYTNILNDPKYRKIFELFGIKTEAVPMAYEDSRGDLRGVTGIKMGWGGGLLREETEIQLKDKLMGRYGIFSILFADLRATAKFSTGLKNYGLAEIKPRPIKGIKSDKNRKEIELGLTDKEEIKRRIIDFFIGSVRYHLTKPGFTRIPTAPYIDILEKMLNEENPDLSNTFNILSNYINQFIEEGKLMNYSIILRDLERNLLERMVIKDPERMAKLEKAYNLKKRMG